MERRAQAADRQVNRDPLLERAPREHVLQPPAGRTAEQSRKPAGLEADRHDHQVIGDAGPLVAVIHGHDDLPFPGVDGHGPPGDRAEPVRLVEDGLRLLREDATVGALEEPAPVLLGQLRPVAGVGEISVLVVALPSGIEDTVAGQDLDRRALVEFFSRLMTTDAAVSPLPITHTLWAPRWLSARSCRQ